MKKQITEPDFIGGLSPRTQEETEALSAYLAAKRRKASGKQYKAQSSMPSTGAKAQSASSF